jgi:hypothetical protein
MAEVWAPFVAEVDSIAHTVTEQGVRVGEEHRERPQAQACKQAQCARRLLGLYEAAERRPPAGRTENEQHQHRASSFWPTVRHSPPRRDQSTLRQNQAETSGRAAYLQGCVRLLSAAAVFLIETFRGLKRARPPASTQLTYASPDVATPSRNRNTSARRLTHARTNHYFERSLMMMMCMAAAAQCLVPYASEHRIHSTSP